MAGHWTPGPWEADLSDPSDVVVWAEEETLVANVGMRVQAVAVAFDIDAKNAHLIAAAPDLYAALSPLIVIALDNLDGMDPETREECERDIATARAALAKARGEA